MTEVPKKKVFRKGQPLGRNSLYRDFAMIEVQNDQTKKDLVPDRSSRSVSDYSYLFLRVFIELIFSIFRIRKIIIHSFWIKLNV